MGPLKRPDSKITKSESFWKRAFQYFGIAQGIFTEYFRNTDSQALEAGQHTFAICVQQNSLMNMGNRIGNMH